jgi:glycosyltransferase involved in cell wall biosynthesis
LFHLHQYSPTRINIPAHYAQARAPLDPPLISLVTPSYNQAAYLPHTISSVIDQGYPRLEYFVQDGNSKDGSVEVLEQFAARLSDWESAPDDGQANAINRGFARTSGTIMGWLNSDDLLLPGSLATIASFFEQHRDVDVVYGSRYIIDAKGREIGRWLLPPHDDELLRWVDYVPQETLYWRRELWERVGGGIDESFDFALDWDLILRFQAAGAKFACLPRFLGMFRVTENTKTSQKLTTIGQEEVDRLRERTLGFVPSPSEVHAQCKTYLRRHNWYRLLNRLGIVRY